MVTLDEYARIRRAHAVEGLGVKALARQFGHSRKKIREILANPEREKGTGRTGTFIIDA